ncbi:MAG: hypothetical protein IAF38_20230, partial [Bacteroidia bacterium]|nr:hypothetical protein [Bacteroidia bacterium]
MKRLQLLLSIILACACTHSYSQTMIINEVSNGQNGNKEWVEFVVVDTNVVYSCNPNAVPPSVDIRGWIFDDNSGYHGAGGVAAGCARFSFDPMWAAVPIGTIIVVYNSADKDPTIPADDLSMSDGNCRIIAPINNITLFEGNATTPGALACSYPAAGWFAGANWNNLLLANAGDCMRLVNLSGCEVFNVCWAADNLNTLIYFNSGGSGSQNVWYFNGGDPNLQVNWSEGNCVTPNDQTPGLPNNAANTTYINQLNNACTPISALVVASGASSNANCGCTGTASVNASGSIPGYTYEWNPVPGSGQGTANASGMCAGTYTCVVTSFIGCQDSVVFIITGTNAINATVSGTNINCFGGNDGTASAGFSGGNGGITYSWSPAPTTGQGTANAGGLTAQTYTVTVTDVAGCTSNAIYAVTEPTQLVSPVTANNISCFGDSNGVVNINASGGTPAYTYVWSPSVSTSSSASSLAAGIYTITVTDANSCTVTTLATITEPTALTAVATSTSISCFGLSDGSADVSVSGGTTNYSYSWFPSGGSSSTATNLNAGIYTITITDANSCTYTTTVGITEPSQLTATSGTTDVLCFGNNSGAASVIASGGTINYSYAWSPSGGTTANETNLVAGIYTCTITDANSCTTTVTATITEPAQLFVSVSTNPSICTGNNGSATSTVSGGNGSYSYSWFPSGGTAANENNLAPGSYTLTVTDANGCVDSSTAIVGSTGGVTVSVASVTNVSCFGLSDGSTSVNASGGTAPITYSWSASNDTTATADSLAAGTYVVTVTDANGCVNVASSVVTEPAQITATTTTTSALCFGNNNGSANVTANGGAGSFIYAWSPTGGTSSSATNLGAGTYSVLITDANSCAVTATAIVTEPAQLTISVTSNPATCSANNGNATTVVNGGTSGYTYSWLPSGGSAATATNLAAGNYSVTVTDTNNCVVTDSVTITSGGSVSLTVSSSTNISCFGLTDGSITVAPGGGTSPFTYSWSPSGGSNATATNLAAGTYTCSITDSTGCTSSVSSVITAPSQLTANATATSVPCFGATSGSASVTVNGGTTNYSYAWSPSGGNNATATNLGAASYVCTITDANGCVVTATASVTQPTQLTANTTSSPASCFGTTNGSATVTVNGGTTNYSYSWLPSGGSNATASGLAAGNYTCTVTDANNCTVTTTISVSQPTQLTLNLTATNINCITTTGSVSSVAGGGTPVYTYSWSPSGSGANPSGLTAGNYTLTLTDANGC